MTTRGPSRAPTRAEQAFLDVLPQAARAAAVVGPSGQNADGPGLIVGGKAMVVLWAGDGSLGDVRRLLASAHRPDIVVGRRLSPGARAALGEAGISWVDETGAAEVALGMIIVSRTGHAAPAPPPPARWTPAVLAAAEALLCGTEATVSRLQEVTGLSTGTCTNALRALADLGLLVADAARGRKAGRRVQDARALLAAYAEAAEALRPRDRMQVGVTWRDPVAGLIETGQRWSARAVGWCATGAAASSVLAPYLTTISATDVYIDTDTMAGLASAAAEAGLRPIEGGRLTLRPMPTVGVRHLASEVSGLRVAPWPRVYVDLLTVGVRGEEAAEHLWEVMHG